MSQPISNNRPQHQFTKISQENETRTKIYLQLKSKGYSDEVARNLARNLPISQLQAMVKKSIHYF